MHTMGAILYHIIIFDLESITRSDYDSPADGWMPLQRKVKSRRRVSSYKLPSDPMYVYKPSLLPVEEGDKHIYLHSNRAEHNHKIPLKEGQYHPSSEYPRKPELQSKTEHSEIVCTFIVYMYVFFDELVQKSCSILISTCLLF